MAVKYTFKDSLYYYVSSANDLCIFRAIHKNNKASEYIFRNIEYDLVKIHYV